MRETKPPRFFGAILSCYNQIFLEIHTLMKSVALVIESCQAPALPTMLGTVIRMVNPLAEMECKRDLEAARSLTFIQTPNAPGHRTAT